MGKTYKVDQENPHADIINIAAQILRDGGVAVYPTETVYGIGARASAGCSGAQELFEIKRRDRNKAIPWLVEDISALDIYGKDVPEYAYTLARKYWPGALTIVVPASDAVPEDFKAHDGTIALRAPDSRLVRALIKAVGAPLVTSSANTHTLPAPTRYEELEARIAAQADIVLDGGETKYKNSSTVISCIGPKPLVWRDSAIPVEEIMEAIQ